MADRSVRVTVLHTRQLLFLESLLQHNRRSLACTLGFL